MSLRPQCLLLWLLFLAVGLAWSIPADAADLSGQWQGSWQSDGTGHRGPLRCTFTKLDDSSYQANFSGRFFRIIPFRYSVVLSAVEENGTTYLTGSHYLGRRYGTFTYTA